MTKAVIFDLDGTLLNTLGDLTTAVNHGLTACGFPTRTEAQVRTFIGDGVKQLIARSCPADADEAARAAVLEAYLPYYAAHNADLTVPYEGVLDLLAELKATGIRLAVVSNKHAPAVEALCARFFGEYLELAVGNDGTRLPKPAPDCLLYAMERMGLAPDEVWFVGDSVQDVLTARAAGVKCAAVTWGFQDEPCLAAEHPAALAHIADEVKKAVLRVRN